MAGKSNQIKHDDIIEDGIFTGTIEQGKQLIQVFAELEKHVKTLAVESTKYFGISIKTLADLEKRKEILDEVTKLEKLHTETVKQRTIVENALTKAEQEKLKTDLQVEKLEQQRAKTDLANLKVQQNLVKESERLNKEKQNSIKNEQLLNSVYEQNKKQLKAVSDRYKELISRGKEGTSTGKLLKAEFDRLDKSVRKAEEGVGQFNRNVGNYKEAVKGALQETGFFNSGIGKLIYGLGELKKQFEENAKSSNKFSSNLKLGVAGGIALAVVALKSLANINSSISQGFEKLGAQLTGFVTGGFKGAQTAAAFKEALFASYDILRKLGLELQKVSLDETDFLDIANDTTIGFKERNAALQESIKLSKERARISIESAKIELDILNKQVASESIGLKKADPELLNKQAEAQKKLNQAFDDESDLLRENAQLQRKLTEERTNAAIDLLLKSKQSANARKATLEKELADEKIQLEQRKKDANELYEVNRDTTKKELAIFKDGFKVKFDNIELLNEQDAIALKQKIESIQFVDENNKLVGLGVEAQKTLAEIVAKYQKDNLDYLGLKKKLQEEEINRTQRILQINSEISIARQADDVRDLEDAYSRLDATIERNFEKLLNSPFSGKLRKQRDLQLKIQKENSEDIFNEQIKLLEKTAELEKQNINATVTDEKLKAAEIKKINEQLNIDLGNIASDKSADDIERNRKELEEEKRLYKKKLEVALDTTRQLTDGVADGLQKKSELQQKSNQKEIDMKNRMLDIQSKLAAGGQDNVLAETLAQTAKAEEAKLQNAKKAAKQQEALALIETFQKTLQAGLKSDKPFLQAFGEALASEGLVSATFSKLFAGFKEGVEGVEGPGTETSDSIPAMLSKGEGVATAKGVKENPGLVTAINKGTVDDYFENIYAPQYNAANSSSTGISQITHDEKLAQIVISELRSVKNSVDNKPVQNVRFEKLSEWDEEIKTATIKTVIHHKKSMGRPSLRLHG